MCLIVFAWQPGQALPLIVAANRDEFYQRPTRPLGPWADAPGVYAGRDLEAGGTWLGVGPEGRFAALTNIRQPGQPSGQRSRGHLVAGFLQGALTPHEYLERVAREADAYAGFNLLVGDGQTLGYLHAHEGVPRLLAPGVYGLSNAALDTPWPKLVRAREALAQTLGRPEPERLLVLLADETPVPDAELPDTGIGLVTERLLSTAFIASPHYGTRARTVVIVDAQGRRQVIERSHGPLGASQGDVSLTL